MHAHNRSYTRHEHTPTRSLTVGVCDGRKYKKTLSDLRDVFLRLFEHFRKLENKLKILIKSAYHGRGTCPVVKLQCSTMLKDFSVPKSLSSSSIHTVSTCFLADKNLPKQLWWCFCVCVKAGGGVSMGVRRLGCRYACVWNFHFDYEHQEPKKNEQNKKYFGKSKLSLSDKICLNRIGGNYQSPR